MARLSRRGRPGARGQILVVGALTIALLLVVLAFALNGAAVTETLATDLDGTHDARDATRFRAAADGAVADLVVTVNRENDSSGAALHAALSAGVADWDRLSARGAAAEGAATEASLAGTTNGSRIRQANATRPLTDAGGNASWTLAGSAAATRSFRMNLSRPALSATCNAGCFRVVADDGSATWRANFTANATAVTVAVDGPDGTATCAAAGDTVAVDLSRGRLGGEPCPALAFATGLEAPYDVRYVDGHLASGTYTLVVDAAVPADGRYATDGSPAVSPALYAATVSVTYRTERLTYAAEFRVVPGEDDG